MADFAEQGALQSIDDLRETIVENFGESVADVGAVDGTQYGIMFKGANKSTIWYNVASFEEAGVEPPETWEELQRGARHAQGRGDHAVLGRRRRRLADHRPLREHLPPHRGARDVRPAGAARDPVDRPVREGRARRSWPTSSATRDYMAGGTEERLQTEMPDSVAKVFTDSPEAAMVVIGDFAPGVIGDDARARDGLQRLHVPVDRGLRPVGRRRRRPLREVQGQPGGGRVPRVPDDAGGGRDLGGARRVLVAEQEPRHERLPGRDHADDGGRAGRGGGVPLRHVRPAAVGVRRNAGAGPVQGTSRTSSQNPDDIDGITEQMEADAAKAFRLGRHSARR